MGIETVSWNWTRRQNLQITQVFHRIASQPRSQQKIEHLGLRFDFIPGVPHGIGGFVVPECFGPGALPSGSDGKLTRITFPQQRFILLQGMPGDDFGMATLSGFQKYLSSGQRVFDRGTDMAPYHHFPAGRFSFDQRNRTLGYMNLSQAQSLFQDCHCDNLFVILVERDETDFETIFFITDTKIASFETLS